MNMDLLTEQDLEQLREKGIPPQEVERQVECFRQGFPALDITAPATVGDGIGWMPPKPSIIAASTPNARPAWTY